MKIITKSLLFFAAFAAFLVSICPNSIQAATGNTIQAFSQEEEEQAPQQKQMVVAEGGADGGSGGNTVNGVLLDDFVNKDSRKLSAAEVAKLAEPFLSDLNKRQPGFAADLREGLKGTFWYLDSKDFKQDGNCLDPNIYNVRGQQIVNACQSAFDVRINPNLPEATLRAMVIHELLRYLQIHKFKTVSEAGLEAVSREIRNKDPKTRLSNADFIDLIHRAGFGKEKYVDLVGIAALLKQAGPALKLNPSLVPLTQTILCTVYEDADPANLCENLKIKVSAADLSQMQKILGDITNEDLLEKISKYWPEEDAAVNAQKKEEEENDRRQNNALINLLCPKLHEVRDKQAGENNIDVELCKKTANITYKPTELFGGGFISFQARVFADSNDVSHCTFNRSGVNLFFRGCAKEIPAANGKRKTVVTVPVTPPDHYSCTECTKALLGYLCLGGSAEVKISDNNELNATLADGSAFSLEFRKTPDESFRTFVSSDLTKYAIIPQTLAQDGGGMVFLSRVDKEHKDAPPEHALNCLLTK